MDVPKKQAVLYAHLMTVSPSTFWQKEKSGTISLLMGGATFCYCTNYSTKKWVPTAGFPKIPISLGAAFFYDRKIQSCVRCLSK